MTETIVFISGKPGAGKSTCCQAAIERLSEWQGGASVRHLSVGSHFRQIFMGEVPSSYTSAVQNAGEQTKSTEVPGYMLVHDVVMEYLNGIQDPGVTLIDGFPKEPELLPVLRKAHRSGSISIAGCIALEVPDALAARRQFERAQVENRLGFGIGDADQRIDSYNHMTQNVVAMLQTEWGGAVIDGTGAREEVSDRFIHALGITCCTR